jgi:ComF family protein
MLSRLMRATFGLFPGRCILCQARTARALDLCLHCETDLPVIPFPCRRCGQQTPQRAAAGLPNDTQVCGQCLIKPPPYARSFSAFAYTQPINQLIAEFKNRRQLVVGRVLAMVLARRYFDQFHERSPITPSNLEPRETSLSAPLAAFIKAVPDNRPLPNLLIPIPLHPKRMQYRGFNQAHEIADAISGLTGIAMDNQLCQRITESPPQKGLSAAARQRNIKQAFQLTRKLHGERLALVDDVLTTGATVSELTRLALNAGADSVEIITLARTPQPRYF